MKKLGLMLLLLPAFPCAAQQGTMAELTGKVQSAGQALASVNVTLGSGAIQGSRMTMTGENGGYRFGLLPPGDYRLRFELQGFSTTEKLVPLALAETARVDVELV